MAGSFFKTGAAGRQESEKFEAQQKAKIEQMKNTPREFWMSRGETQKVLFLDDPDFYVKRHSIKIRNSYEKITCVEDMGIIGGCPGCSQKSPAYCVAATVITLTPTKDAKGNTYVYQKRVLCVSGDSKKYLEKLRDKKGSLKYCIVELSRGTAENSPAVGSYDFEGKISKDGFEKLQKNIVAAKINGDTPIAEYFKPFDYTKVFAPLPIDDMHKMFGTSPTTPYGANMDDFSADTNDLLESSSSIDESPFGGDTPPETPAEGYGAGEDDLADTLPDDVETTEAAPALSGFSDKEILTKMLEYGCTIKAAKKMTREEREAWLLEQGFGGAAESDADLEDMDDDALAAILRDYGLPEKNIAGMDKEDMIEAIKEFQAND